MELTNSEILTLIVLVARKLEFLSGLRQWPKEAEKELFAIMKKLQAELE